MKIKANKYKWSERGINRRKGKKERYGIVQETESIKIYKKKMTSNFFYKR